MRVDSSGRVGIGTTSPAQKLDIGSGYLNFSNDYGIRWGGATSVALYGNQTSNFLGFQTNSSERMRIDSGGRVMIAETSNSGYSNNADDLIVGDNGSATERGISLGSTSASAIRWNDGADAGLVEYVHSDNSMRLYTAASERMRIDSSGNVGIGTSSPSHPLVVSRSGAGIKAFFTNTSDADFGINLSSGITLLTPTTGTLALGTSNTERMRINSSGQVIINRTSPIGAEVFTVQAAGSASNCTFFKHATTDDRSILNTIHDGSSGGTSRPHLVTHNSSGVAVGSISANGSSTAYNTSSDARLKDVTGEARGLEVINELNPIAYNWKESGQADEGLIAQEVLDIVPNAVTGSEEKYYQMDYSKLVVHLVAGMKEQQAQIEALQSEINELKNS
jgi:hypothetical protein